MLIQLWSVVFAKGFMEAFKNNQQGKEMAKSPFGEIIPTDHMQTLIIALMLVFSSQNACGGSIFLPHTNLHVTFVTVIKPFFYIYITGDLAASV